MTDPKAIWDYAAQPKQLLKICNLCGHPSNITRDQRDRYGYWVGVDTCHQCGLIFLNPRMTKEAYARFYADGTYRRLVSAFHGREINAQTIQPEQEEYGFALAQFLEPWVRRPMSTLLDVGGSTGVVARVLGDCLHLLPTVLDPSPAELAEAENLPGPMDTILASVEDWEPQGRTWDVVTLCQTVDHLLDIAGTLKKLKACLAPGGVFFVDIVDYDRTRTIKVDHPFNLTEQTMLAFLDRAGFTTKATNRAADGVHLRFLCQ